MFKKTIVVRREEENGEESNREVSKGNQGDDKKITNKPSKRE